MDKPEEARIRDKILRRIGERGPGKTIYPSEVARAFSAVAAKWRPLMPDVRRVATALQGEGKLVITKKGVPVQGPDLAGPFRLGLAQTRS